MNFLINRKFLKKNKIKKVRSINENCKLWYVKIKDVFLIYNLVYKPICFQIQKNV